MNRTVRKIVIYSCLMQGVLTVNAQEKLLEINGFIEADHISYFKKENSRNQGTFQLDLKKEFSSKAEMFSSLEFREDFSDPFRNRIWAKEYYVDLFFKSFDVRIGKQRYYWGRADGINVTSNLSPVDFSDFLDTEDEELGILSVSIKYYLRNWSFQGVFVPVFIPSTLPAENSVWDIVLPDKIRNPQSPDLLITPIYQLLPDITPEKNLNSARFASKIDGQLGGVDLSASFYHGYSDLPEVINIPGPYTNDTLFIGLQQVYLPWDVVGLDFATNVGPFGFRGEGAYFIPSGKEAAWAHSKDDFIQYSLGMDYMTSVGQRNSTLVLLAEWMHEVVPSGRKYPSTSLNHLFQKSMLGRTEFTYRNILSVAIQGIYNMENQDYYFQPKLSYKVIDNLNITLLADFLNGSSESFFGMYRANDRVQFKMKYHF